MDKKRVEEIRQARKARRYETVRDDLDTLTREDLYDTEWLDYLVKGIDRYNTQDLENPDRFWEQFSQNVSANVTEEIDWLSPELRSITGMYADDTPYEAIREAVKPLPELVVAPQAAGEFGDMSQDRLRDRRDTYPGSEHSYDLKKEHEDLFVYTNKSKSDVTIADSRLHGKNLLRDTDDLTVSVCYLTGDHLLQNTRKLVATDTVMDAPHLLRFSDDVILSGTVLYGEDTLKHVGSYDIRDAFILGRSPLAFTADNESEPQQVTNTVIAGKYPLYGNRDAALENVIVAGEKPLAQSGASLRNSFVVTPEQLCYYEDGSARQPTRTTSFEEKELQEFLDSFYQGEAGER